jgi:hypothetical protein
MSTPSHWIAIELTGESRYAVIVARHGSDGGGPLVARPIPDGDEERRELFRSLVGRGPSVMVVEEPAALARGLAATAGAAGCDVAFLPGVDARRDAEDVDVTRPREIGRRGAALAELALARPSDLLSLPADVDTSPIDEDAEVHDREVRHLRQLRLFVEQRYPEVAKVLSPHLDHPAVLALLEQYSTPDDMRAAGRRRLRSLLRRLAPSGADPLLDRLMAALAHPDSMRETPNVERVIPNRASALRTARARRHELAAAFALSLLGAALPKEK